VENPDARAEINRVALARLEANRQNAVVMPANV
jgi:hypothetical protein